MCQGSCKSATCKNTCSPAEAQLRRALSDIEALARQHMAPVAAPGVNAAPAVSQAVNPVLAVIASRAAEGLQAPASATVVRMRIRPDDGPIPGARITQRMKDICGCKGVYDCDCVSVQNQATRELWSEHNQRQREQQAA